MLRRPVTSNSYDWRSWPKVAIDRQRGSSVKGTVGDV
jgi:hypothetical protein